MTHEQTYYARTNIVPSKGVSLGNVYVGCVLNFFASRVGSIRALDISARIGITSNYCC